jgi:hypothetical protein
MTRILEATLDPDSLEESFSEFEANRGCITQIWNASEINASASTVPMLLTFSLISLLHKATMFWTCDQSGDGTFQCCCSANQYPCHKVTASQQSSEVHYKVLQNQWICCRDRRYFAMQAAKPR